MALIYPAAAAGISALLGIGYTYTHLTFTHADSLTSARASGRKQGRTETLAELLRFGPRRLRRMCLEAGVRFSPSNTSDPDTDSIFNNESEDQDVDEEEVEERVIYEGLVREMTELLKSELRESLRPDVMGVVRTQLRSEIMGDGVLILGLKADASEGVKREFQQDGALRNEVRGEVKRKIRRDFLVSGKERELVAEAIQDLRAEAKERLRRDLKEEVREELKRELREKVRRESEWTITLDLKREREEEREKLKRELKEEVKRELRRELEAPVKADLLSELRDMSAEKILGIGTSVATTRMR